jgi:hypothetical protein
MKKTSDDLYTRVLLWAYGKVETGFTWSELIAQFHLSTLQEAWVRKVFLTTSDADRKFFEILRNDETTTPNVYYYSLNEKGMSAVVDYLELKEARKSGKNAMYIAVGSLVIATIVGIAQIVVQIFF